MVQPLWVFQAVKRLVSAILIALALWAQSASAAPALVRSAKSGACSTSCTATFSVATTAGNTIIGVVSEFYSFSNFGFSNTITDDGSNTYGTAYTHDNGAAGPSIKVSYIDNAASATVVTSTSSTGSQFDFVVMEVSGLATSTSLDQAGGYHQDVATTAYTANSITTTQADEFVLGVHLLNSTGTINATPSGLFTTVITNTSNNPTLQTQYYVASSTGSYTSAGAWDISGITDSAMVSFKGAGGGGATSHPCASLRLLGVGC